MSTETDVENRSPRGRVPSGECKKSSRSIRQPLSPKLPVVQLEIPYSLPVAPKFSSIDFSTVAQAYLNILVGASFVIGLKHAGTCDSEATELLVWFMCTSESVLSKCSNLKWHQQILGRA